MFTNPFTIMTDKLVAHLQETKPGLVLLGGMASSARQAEGAAVFIDDQVLPGGAAMLGLSGVQVRPVVAQGAEPLGQPWIVTECTANMVQTLGSRPALDVLTETLSELDEVTRDRAARNLLIGLAMDEYKLTHERGDFLIRNVMGADRESGALAINEVPRVGQTFQFQFRDAGAADDDLRTRLAATRDSLGEDEEVLGALLCSCNGRGRGLFGEPDHDAAALAEAFGPVPTAGFFCNGEIGPVGGSNYLHGFTASIALLTTGSGGAKIGSAASGGGRPVSELQRTWPSEEEIVAQRKRGMRPVVVWVPECDEARAAEVERQTLELAASAQEAGDIALMDSLAEWLDERGGAVSGPALKPLPTWSGGPARVDIADRAALDAVLDGSVMDHIARK